MSKRSHSKISASPGPLGNILNSLSRTNESTMSAKRAEANVARVTATRGHAIRVDQAPLSPEVAITQFLQSIRTSIDQKGFGGNIEIELRLGKITSCLDDARCRPSVEGVHAAVVLNEEKMRGLGAKFVPGIHEAEFPFFSKSTKYLLRGDSFVEQHEKQIVHTFPRSKRVIEEIDPNTGITQRPFMQVKERLGSIDIFLPTCQYDCRISVSCEFPPQEVEGSISDYPNKECIRKKNRSSAVGRDLRVDLTEVSTEGREQIKSYEVEVELSQLMVEEWLKQSDQEGKSWNSATINAGNLWKMVKYFMPNAGQALKHSWDFDGANEIQNYYQVRLGVRNKFGGTMPVGFARWHIPLVMKREYFVSEKTDGVRYFLVVGGNRTVLVDRSNSVFTSSGIDLLNGVLPRGTVLDGEFVFHQKEKKYVYMVFDVIATGASPSDSHVHKPFNERLRILNDFLAETGPYASGIREQNLSRSLFLTVLRKRWVPVRQICDVFKQIEKVKKRDGTIARIYGDDKRVHFTDGVVFCPNTPYIVNTHKEYLKWKWSDLITVDFLATLNDAHELSLSCGGPRNTQIDLDQVVVLDEKDQEAVESLLMKIPNKSAILEFAFNPDKGLWHYKCARPDKDSSNYIKTVLSSLVNMAEAISEEELQFRLATGAQGEQWNDQMKKMRRTLLEHTLNASS